MTQNVDFLKSIPKPKTHFPAHWIILSVVITLFLLLSGSIILGINQWLTQNSLKKAQADHQQAVSAFQKMAEQYPLLTSDTPLVTKVADFEKTLRDKEAVFALLTHATSRKPFSSYMLALASTTPKGLWLTSISINQNSGNISLEGLSLQPIYITTFLKQLKSTPPFSDEVFDLFAIEKNTEQNGVHHFEIANNQLLNKTLLHNSDNEEKQDHENK
jgi:Tfp pilus assembly protein PilN